MATGIDKADCVTCGKGKATSKCSGCLKDFCFNHLVEHRQQLSKQLDDLENKRNIFRQTLTEQINQPQKHSLIQQINQWEKGSIEKIQQTADEARNLLLKHPIEHLGKIEVKLTKLTEELKEIREENDFNEIDVNQLKEKLKQLEEQLNNPSNISIQQDSSSFIKKISVVMSSGSIAMPNISDNARWTQIGIAVAGGNGKGNALNRLSNPLDVYVDDDQTIYVADQSNHRIVEWKSGATTGQVVAGGNGEGDRNDQLNGPRNVIVDQQNDCLLISDYNNQRIVRWPRRNGTSGQTIVSNISCWGLSMDNDGYLYVSDVNKHEARRYKIGETNGTVVAGGNGAGNRLDQLKAPYFICIDQDHSVYVSDCNNHRVMKWVKGAKEGIIVAGGRGSGNDLTQLSNPGGVLVDQLGTLYVADYSNHRVMRWLKGAREGSVIVGANGQGGQTNQFNGPLGLSFDRQNNLYVLDYNNDRVQKFHINPNA